MILLRASALAALLATSPAVPDVAITLGPNTQDVFLPTPTTPIALTIDARRGPDKARIMFLDPLPRGAHRLSLKLVAPSSAPTLVIAIPVARGQSTFDVTIQGPPAARYDFGFFSTDRAAPPKDHRHTIPGHPGRSGSTTRRRFSVDL